MPEDAMAALDVQFSGLEFGTETFDFTADVKSSSANAGLVSTTPVNVNVSVNTRNPTSSTPPATKDLTSASLSSSLPPSQKVHFLEHCLVVAFCIPWMLFETHHITLVLIKKLEILRQYLKVITRQCREDIIQVIKFKFTYEILLLLTVWCVINRQLYHICLGIYFIPLV